MFDELQAAVRDRVAAVQAAAQERVDAVCERVERFIATGVAHGSATAETAIARGLYGLNRAVVVPAENVAASASSCAEDVEKSLQAQAASTARASQVFFRDVDAFASYNIRKLVGNGKLAPEDVAIQLGLAGAFQFAYVYSNVLKPLAKAAAVGGIVVTGAAAGNLVLKHTVEPCYDAYSPFFRQKTAEVSEFLERDV